MYFILLHFCEVRISDPDYEANKLLVNSHAMNGIIEEAGCLARAVSFAAVLHITRSPSRPSFPTTCLHLHPFTPPSHAPCQVHLFKTRTCNSIGKETPATYTDGVDLTNSCLYHRFIDGNPIHIVRIIPPPHPHPFIPPSI